MLLRLKTILLSGSLALVLTACGGGGDNSSSFNPLSPNPDSFYQGKTDPALLDSLDTPLFASLIVGDNSSTETQSRKSTQSNITLTNQPQIANSLINITNKITALSSLQGRNVSETIDCEYGGKASRAGEVDDYGDVVAMVYTFDNCYVESDIVANGKSSEQVSYANGTSSTTQAYENFEISEAGESFQLTGTIIYSETETSSDGFNYETRIKKTIINLTSIHSPSGVSSYLENYANIKVLDLSDYEHQQSISGRIYLSTEGYVTLSTSNDYLTVTSISSDADNNIPKSGYIFITGASKSKARIRNATHDAYYTNNEYRLDLDEDGDDIYELSSLQNTESSTTVDLSANQPPVAVIYAQATSYGLDPDTGTFRYNTITHNDNEKYPPKTSFYIHPNNSYDEESFALTFDWTIEERPEGSSAKLILTDEEDKEYRFVPDVNGEYKISLKVTDDLGSSQSNIDFINISITNGLPTIEKSSFNSSFFLINTNQSVTVTAEDIGAPELPDGTPDLSLSYIWLEKPENSNAIFTLTSSVASLGSGEYASSLRNVYSTYLDKEGTYKAQFTVTDSDGATSSVIHEITADDPKLLKSDLECSYNSTEVKSCGWDMDFIQINTATTISLKPDFYSVENCTWIMSSHGKDSAGNSEVFYGADNYISFTPTLLGEYDFGISCVHSGTWTFFGYNTTLNVVKYE